MTNYRIVLIGSPDGPDTLVELTNQPVAIGGPIPKSVKMVISAQTELALPHLSMQFKESMHILHYDFFAAMKDSLYYQLDPYAID